MTAAPTYTRLESQDIIDPDGNGRAILDQNGAFQIFSDGNGNLTAGTFHSNQTTNTVQTLASTNAIIVPASTGVVRVTTAAAVTGITLPVGTRPGQQLIVIHEGAAANTITFAASGTSNVADGVSAVITGPSQKMFVWDSVTSLWDHY